MIREAHGIAGSSTRGLWLDIVAWTVMLFLLTPIFITIPMSFSDSQYLAFPPEKWSLRWYRNFFGSSEWMDSAWVSARVAFFTVVLATPLGTAAAYGLDGVKGKRADLMRALLTIPMIVPVVIIAIGVFYIFAWIGLVNTITGLVVAHTVLAIPFVFLIVTSGLAQFDRELELAAVSLGASRWRAFFTVTLPLIQRSIYVGALVALVTSLDEVVVSLFISFGEYSTLTRRMFSFLRDQVDPTIAAISTILIVTTTLVVVLVVAFSGRDHLQGD